jgi:trigger factor
VKSSVEPLEGNKVKVYVEVDAAEFAGDIDAAFITIAKEVKLPGFRNGKVPRRVLESRIGLAPAREQALRDAVPRYLTQAVREHDVDLVATPQVEITAGTDDGDVEFEAECEVRPEISIPGYGGLRVEIDSPVIDESAIDEAVDQQLRAHGTLADLDRPIADGDIVTIDMTATRDGEELAGLNIDDWSYEVGQGWVAEDFDEQLRGASNGDTSTFTTTPKGTDAPADFTVKITAVSELVLPELTDEWVQENLMDAEDVASWRDSISERLTEERLGTIRQTLVGKVTDSLVELVEEDAPESMVAAEQQQRVQNLLRQFQAQGMDVAQWMQVTGQSVEDLMESMREQAVTAVKADLALRAIVRAESIEVTGDDLDIEYQRMAMQFNEKSDAIRKAYERNDAVPELIAQIAKGKAVDWLLHNIEMVDADGTAVDRDLVLGHDHDHDDDTDADGGDDDGTAMEEGA